MRAVAASLRAPTARSIWDRAVLLGIVVAATACATAGKDSGNNFNNGGADAPVNGQRDAPVQPGVDGAMTQPDATIQIDGSVGPMTAMLTQTADNNVTVGSSVTCGNSTAGYTSLNTWYRTFSPAAAGVTGPFTVTRVDFAAQEASGTQQVQVFVGTYTGTLNSPTLDETKLTSLGNAVVSVPATSAGEALSATITGVTIPAGANMYAEILSPDHNGTTTYFYVGASAGSETASGYIKASVCGVSTPEKLKTAATTAGSLILSVTGTY